MCVSINHELNWFDLLRVGEGIEDLVNGICIRRSYCGYMM